MRRVALGDSDLQVSEIILGCMSYGDPGRGTHPWSLPEDERPTMFYAGDGVSDLSAARETDLLFAKKGHDLINYCARENVPFTVFADWTNILAKCKEIVEGKTTVQEAAKAGFEAYKNGAAGLDTQETVK